MWWVQLILEGYRRGPVVRVRAPMDGEGVLQALDIARPYFQQAWPWYWERREHRGPFHMLRWEEE